MYPKILMMQAFGPYVEKQTIDFRAWDKQHLFLIRGETGSGKTMILDAMTYALYGKSSGGQREDLESMRSRFAEDDQMTFVDFTFQIQEREYRFYRKVEVRTKRNKEKVLKVSVDAGEIIDGTYYPFFENPKQKGIEEKARELIGLSHEQFIQVMVLPQGMFERLLVSKSDEKQEILKTLFQMENWSKINEYLVESMRKKKAEIDEKKQQVEGYLKGVEAASVQELQDWVNKADEETSHLQESSVETAKQLSVLRDEVQLQKQIRIWHKEQEEALAKKAELIKQQAAYDDIRKEYEQQKRLQVLLPYVAAEVNAHKELEERKERQDKASSFLKEMEVKREKMPEKEAAVKELEIELRKQDQALSLLREKRGIYLDLQKHQTKLAAIMAEEERLDQAYAHSVKSIQEKKEEHETMTSQIQQLTEALRVSGVVEEQYAAMRQANYLNQQYVKAKQKLHEIKEETDVLLCQLKQQETKLKERQTQHDALYRNILDNSALQLATLLQDEKPCPVCGSCHHPHPATLKQEYVDVLTLKKLQEEIDILKSKYEECQQQHGMKTSLYQNKEAEAATIQEEIHKLLGKAYKEEEYTAIEKEVKNIQAWRKQKEKLQQALNHSMNQQVQQETQKEQQEKQLQECRIQKAGLRSSLDHLHAQLPDTLPSLEAFDAHMTNLTAQRAQKASQLSTQQEELSKFLLTYEKAKQEAAASVIEADKAAKAYQNAITSLQDKCHEVQIRIEEVKTIKREDTDKLQEQIRQYETACVQVETTLENIRKHLASSVQKDLEVLSSQLHQLEQEDKEQRAHIAALQTQKTMYMKIIFQVEKVYKELQEEEPKYIRMNQFVKAMRGDNGIGIERYVLGVMLGNITQSANKLLEHVHDGRYRIYRSDEASGRTRKYGLELSIYDAYTCSQRSVVSLSGGEKFLVSLALSLALSAVVQARNGGVHFDAMFIDEGFGTLDEHSIADALHVLNVMGVRKGLVGIISHVELLKENISAGIEVVKSRKGSHIIMRKD